MAGASHRPKRRRPDAHSRYSHALESRSAAAAEPPRRRAPAGHASDAGPAGGCRSSYGRTCSHWRPAAASRSSGGCSCGTPEERAEAAAGAVGAAGQPRARRSRQRARGLGGLRRPGCARIAGEVEDAYDLESSGTGLGASACGRPRGAGAVALPRRVPRPSPMRSRSLGRFGSAAGSRSCPTRGFAPEELRGEAARGRPRPASTRSTRATSARVAPAGAGSCRHARSPPPGAGRSPSTCAKRRSPRSKPRSSRQEPHRSPVTAERRRSLRHHQPQMTTAAQTTKGSPMNKLTTLLAVTVMGSQASAVPASADGDAGLLQAREARQPRKTRRAPAAARVVLEALAWARASSSRTV